MGLDKIIIINTTDTSSVFYKKFLGIGQHKLSN